MKGLENLGCVALLEGVCLDYVDTLGVPTEEKRESELSAKAQQEGTRLAPLFCTGRPVSLSISARTRDAAALVVSLGELAAPLWGVWILQTED